MTRRSRVTAKVLMSLGLIGLAEFGTGCAVQVQKRTLTSAAAYQSLDDRSPYLKAHMRDGRVFILSEWRIDESARSIRGEGVILGANREVSASGPRTVAIDSVAIFETNVVSTSPAVAAMSVLTGASVGLTIYCIANPKACFGSCPTFYAETGGDSLLLAEGFSSSVAPALEAPDIDALSRHLAPGEEFRLRMTNEALETHVVRHADLLAIPRAEGRRAFVTGEGRFWLSDAVVTPSEVVTAAGPDPACRALLSACDGHERISLADPLDLATKETLDFVFNAPAAPQLGLVVGYRQSLLSTFLFYQTLAYMGRQTATWIGELERAVATNSGDAPAALGGIGQRLGGIEVFVRDESGDWVAAGRLGETGPLATNVNLLPLPPLPPGPCEIRLRLTKGCWRLDSIGLAILEGPVRPLRLPPAEVLRAGRPDPSARRRLCDPAQTLTTLPGDKYTLVYRLPAGSFPYELFLESRGYYLEWIREPWLAEEDAAAAAMMIFQPEIALRRLAPAFKEIEPELEDLFWGSRYVRR